MRVALYARVSTEKQADNDLSIAAQLNALRKYAEQRKWIIFKEFLDEGESARTANRPAFQEMITLSKSKTKPFESILIWKFSRFARNREDAIIYKSLLRKFGVNVVSINEQVDDSPAGRLLEGIIEVIDEFYSLNLAEDTIRGQKENARRGFQNGTIPIGYKGQKVFDGNNERTKLVPDEAFAPVVQRIFQMNINNTGIKEIALTLNREGIKTNKGKLWSNSKISYVLKNETYTGTLVWNKHSRHKTTQPEDIIRVENNHPALISKEDFAEAQKLLFSRSPKVIHPRQISSDYLLSGLLFCGKCGLRMQGSPAKSRQFFYYACQNYLKKGKTCCDMKLIGKGRIEGLIIDRIKSNILTEENLSKLYRMVLEELNENREEIDCQLSTVDRQIENLKQRLDNLYSAIETGKLTIDDIAPRIKEVKAQIELLNNRRIDLLNNVQAPQTPPFGMDTLKTYVNDLTDLLLNSTVLEKKTFLRSFIQKVTVHYPRLEIDYTFPLPMKKTEPHTNEVLSLVQNGVADGT
ncbi:MAG: recombinase family protein [Endomicrobiales bacterium]